jgi:hypothetical protein
MQLVDEVRTMTDAEQWLIVAAVALLVVSYTFWVGLAVVLVARTIVSIGRGAAAKIRGLARRATVRTRARTVRTWWELLEPGLPPR